MGRRTAGSGPRARSGKRSSSERRADLQLETDERRSNTVVPAVSEREVGSGGPIDEEGVGIVEDLRVAIGGAEQQGNPLTRANRLAGNHGVAQGDPGEAMERGIEAQDLFDRPWDEGWIFSQPIPKVGRIPSPRGAVARHWREHRRWCRSHPGAGERGSTRPRRRSACRRRERRRGEPAIRSRHHRRPERGSCGSQLRRDGSRRWRAEKSRGWPQARWKAASRSTTPPRSLDRGRGG